MIVIRELFETFFGRIPVETIARQRPSLKEGLFFFLQAFLLVAILAGIELFVFRLAWGLYFGEPTMGLGVGLLIFAVGALVAIPLFFVLEIVFLYILGALIFLVAGLFRRDRGQLNEFNAGFLTVFSSVHLVVGLLVLIPVLGWIAALIAKAYSVVLEYRFVRSRFGLSDAQAGIAVLIPVNAILFVVLLLVCAVSFVLISQKIL